MAERILGPTGSKRRKRFLFVPFLCITALALIFLVGAQAGVSPMDNGLFQLEGNTLPGTFSNPAGALCGKADDGVTAAGDDWAALYEHQSSPVNNPCKSDAYSFVQDRVGSSQSALGTTDVDNTYWSGGGSKDAYNPASGPWLWSNGDTTPDKDDIVNAFAALYHGPGTVSS